MTEIEITAELHDGTLTISGQVPGGARVVLTVPEGADDQEAVLLLSEFPRVVDAGLEALKAQAEEESA